jgi:hypothetical protein
MSQVLYRLYTESGEGYLEQIINALKNWGFEHFTLVPAVGYGPDQNEKPERTTIVEVLTENCWHTSQAIRCVVAEINYRNNQQSILVVRIPVAYSLLTSRPKPKPTQLPLPVPILPGETVPHLVGVPPTETPARIVAHRGKWQMLLKAVEASGVLLDEKLCRLR